MYIDEGLFYYRNLKLIKKNRCTNGTCIWFHEILKRKTNRQSQYKLSLVFYKLEQLYKSKLLCYKKRPFFLSLKTWRNFFCIVQSFSPKKVIKNIFFLLETQTFKKLFQFLKTQNNLLLLLAQSTNSDLKNCDEIVFLHKCHFLLKSYWIFELKFFFEKLYYLKFSFKKNWNKNI